MAESNLQVLDAAEEQTELSDSQLVEQYLQTKSTADFELIVERYAKLVMGVCRRVLQHPEDAEDAFQATFVVLAQSVHKLKKRESLGSWLHGVAYRIGRRHAHELYRKKMSPLAGEPMSDEDGLKSLETRFEQQLLDEELQRVSEHYREVLVLRYLEEKSSREISETLGVSIGTVEGRLQRGKAELRRRLLRRGVTATGVLLSVELLRNTASASVTSTLIQQTATTAVATSAGGLTSTVVASLATKEIAVMSASKLAFITACVVLPVTLMLSGDSEFSGTDTMAMAQVGGGFDSGGARGSRNSRTPRRVIDTSVQWERKTEVPVAAGTFRAADPQVRNWDKIETRKEQASAPSLGTAANGKPFTIQIKDEKGTLMSLKVTESQFNAMMSQLKNTMKADESKGGQQNQVVLPAAEAGSESGYSREKQPVPFNSGANQRKNNDTVDYYDQSPAEQKILTELQGGTEIEFVDTPLKDAMQYLSDLHNINIMIDEKGLEEIGHQSDVPQNIALSGVTLKSALKLVLDPQDLTYVIEDEVMKITTKDVANSKMTTKVYEIRDIAADPDALIGALTAGTETSWFDVDGHGGTISALPGSLVIKQTYEGHRQIVDLLTQIRRHNSNPLYQRVGADPFSSGRPTDSMSSGFGNSMPRPSFIRREYADPLGREVGITLSPKMTPTIRSESSGGIGATDDMMEAAPSSRTIRKQNQTIKRSVDDDFVGSLSKQKSSDEFGSDDDPKISSPRSDDPFGTPTKTTKERPVDDGFGTPTPRQNMIEGDESKQPSKTRSSSRKTKKKSTSKAIPQLDPFGNGESFPEN